MSTDGKGKGRDGLGEPDDLFTEDPGLWDDAVEDWDMGLDIPEEELEAQDAKAKAQAEVQESKKERFVPSELHLTPPDSTAVEDAAEEEELEVGEDLVLEERESRGTDDLPVVPEAAAAFAQDAGSIEDVEVEAGDLFLSVQEDAADSSRSLQDEDEDEGDDISGADEDALEVAEDLIIEATPIPVAEMDEDEPMELSPVAEGLNSDFMDEESPEEAAIMELDAPLPAISDIVPRSALSEEPTGDDTKVDLDMLEEQATPIWEGSESIDIEPKAVTLDALVIEQEVIEQPVDAYEIEAEEPDEDEPPTQPIEIVAEEPEEDEQPTEVYEIEAEEPDEDEQPTEVYEIEAGEPDEDEPPVEVYEIEAEEPDEDEPPTQPIEIVAEEPEEAVDEEDVEEEVAVDEEDVEEEVAVDEEDVEEEVAVDEEDVEEEDVEEEVAVDEEDVEEEVAVDEEDIAASEAQEDQSATEIRAGEPTPTPGEDLDIGSLIQDFVGDSTLDALKKEGKVPEVTTPEDQEADEADETTEAEEPEHIAALDEEPQRPIDMPSMDLFDEILPAGEGDDPLADTEPTVSEADQAPAEEEPEEPRQWTIPEALEDEDHTWETLDAPELPADLAAMDLETLELPEQVTALEQDAGSWRAMGQELMVQLGEDQAKVRSADLFYLAGHALERAGDAQDALLCYRELLQREPEQLPALRALRRLHGARGQAEEVAEVLEMQMHLCSGKELEGLLATRAEHLWPRTEGQEEALELAAKLQETEGGKLRALLIQADLAAATGDNKRLDELLEQLCKELEETPHASALWLERGHRKELEGDPEKAEEAYCQAAEAADETPTGVSEGLLRLAHNAADPGVMAQRLLDSVEDVEQGSWAAQRLLRAAELSQLHEVEGVDAAALINRAVEAAPDDTRVMQALAGQTDADKDPAETVALLKEQAEEAFYPEQKALALAEAAVVAERALEDRDQALELYQEAASILPDFLPATLALARLDRNDPDPAKRLEVMQQAGEGAGTAEKLNNRLHMAHLLAEELGQEQEALAMLQECLELDASFRPAVELLELTYREQGDHEALVAMLTAAAEAAKTTAEGEEYHQRAAWIYEGPLSRPSGALEQYQKLAASNQEEPSFRAGVRRCLEQMGQVDQLAEELSAQASACTVEPLAARILAQRGDILAAAMLTEDALASYNEAYKRQPGYLSAIYALVEGHARDANWQEVERLWTELMEALPAEDPRRKAFTYRLAALHQTELEDPDRAITLFRQAAQAPCAVPGAHRALQRALEQAGEMEEVVAEMISAAEEEQDPHRRATLLVTAAERVGENEEASGTTVQALLLKATEADPDSSLARGALLAHQHTTGQLKPQESIQEQDQPRSLVEDAGQVPEDDPDRTDILLELGRVAFFKELTSTAQQDAEADQVSPATSLLQMAAAGTSDILLPLRFLLDRAWMDNNAPDLAKYYQQLAGIVEEKREAAVLYTRAGEQLTQGAAEPLVKALELQPDLLGAIYRLRDIALREEDWETACGVVEVEASASADQDHIATAHMLAAELARTRLSDPDRALSSYQECLAVEPDNFLAFQQVRQLLANDKRWEELSSLLLQRAQVESSRKRLAEIYGALAELAQVYLEDRSQAKRYLRMLVQLQPESVDALKQLADMYFQDEQWQETSHTLLSLARLEGSHERLKQIFLRLGLIYREKTPDTARAVASYRKVLALDPANLEALGNLSDLLTAEGQHEQALKVTQLLLQRDRDKSHQVAHLLRVASIQEKGLRDAHSASQAYRKAMELAPLDVEVIKAVAMFYTRQRDQRSLLVHLDRSVTAMRGKQEKAPFAPFAYSSLLKVFGWRKASDRCLFTAQLLETLGHGDEETAKLTKGSTPTGDPERYLADTPHDEPLFTNAVPGGFRLVFQMMAENFTKLFKGDLKRYKLGRSDRISDPSNAIYRIGEHIAKAMGVPGFELYISKEHPRILVVENTVPPTIIVGQALVEGAHENEIRFIMGRSMWLIKKAMILPALLKPEDLEILVASVVRQYKEGFKPKDVDERKLSTLTNQVRKLTKKMQQELMPFALECSGKSVNPKIMGLAVINASNRAGLLICRTPQAAVASLAKLGGQNPPGAMGNQQLEALLRFVMTDAHFDLRQSIGISDE